MRGHQLQFSHAQGPGTIIVEESLLTRPIPKYPSNFVANTTSVQIQKSVNLERQQAHCLSESNKVRVANSNIGYSYTQSSLPITTAPLMI